KYCTECGKEYHLHKNGKVKGACEHIVISEMKGRHTFKGIITDSQELDKMLDGW
ncbi:unnamed protein product, partial [marine sediment metagenome]